ncbi:MAG: prolyl oligopeptidase family serine peptidase [Planctomycetes bacterium]|nr:prolyl oligopeptidase family serine peptidase [Planctomycetota bacterium]
MTVRLIILIIIVAILMSASLAAHAVDAIAKLEMTPVEERAGDNGRIIRVVKHKAVAGMDSPGYVAAGQEYHVSVGIPATYKAGDTKKIPAILVLHGFGDTWQAIVSFANFYPELFVIVPNDPLGTWYYGYSDQLPGGDPNKGMVVNYTERRLLAYLDHFQKEYPIDANRIYVAGGSMGGTGATSLALRYPKIFAGADAKKGATNRIHCKWLNQCSTIWGNVDAKVTNNDGENVWDWQNMAWFASKHHQDATWLRTAHGREDVSIPYRQVAGPPGVQPMSFYDALETFKIGHQCLWDQSSHSKRPPTPFTHDDWWDAFTDATCYLALDKSFPAFTKFSANGNPGTGAGDAVGTDNDLGDNTYDGDKDGGFNRFLRWNTTTIVDEPATYAIDLKLSSGANGYKGAGERVDVTPRRLQKFAIKPGSSFAWKTSTGQTGEAKADAESLLTLPAVKVTAAWTTLTVTPKK